MPSTETPQTSRARSAALLVGITAVYFVAGKVGLDFFGLLNPSASAVWPPTGVAIASLLLFGYRAAGAVFAGAFLVNYATAGGVLASLGIAAGNTLEGVAAAYLVTRFAHGAAAFERAVDLAKYAALAAVLSTAVSATIGVGILTLAGLAAPASLRRHLAHVVARRCGRRHSRRAADLAVVSRPAASCSPPREAPSSCCSSWP